MSFETNSSTLDVVRQVFSLRKTQELAYGISGVLNLKNSKLPFDKTGILVEKGELSGLLNP